MTAVAERPRARRTRRTLPPVGVRIGPTGLPPAKRTLGWQQLGWMAEYLETPDGPNAGAPLVLTDEQARWWLWYYAIDDRGRFLYRYAVLERMKGWGKDPMAAFIAAVEFVGPCRFGGWDARGYPIAVPNATSWVQVAAVSKDQTRNTMKLFAPLFGSRPKGQPQGRAIVEFGIDVGKEVIYAGGGRRTIEAVTSSPRAVEGGRPDFVVANETEHWRASNEGHAMAEVIQRNLDKRPDGAARALAICNAYAPGEDSVAQRDWEGYCEAPEGILYDAVRANDDVVRALHRLREHEPAPGDLQLVQRGLEWCRGDSHWLDIERIMASSLDPRRAMVNISRFFFNVPTAAEDRAFSTARWAELATQQEVPAGTFITMGFDGSVSGDHTALIGTVVETGHQFVIGYWEPMASDEYDEPHIPEADVDATVTAAFERYAVWRLYADPFYWNSWVSTWRGRFRDGSGKSRVVEFATNSILRMSRALLAYRGAMAGGELSHDGDPRFAAAVANAVQKPCGFRDDQGEPMWTIEKERPGSPFKIDAVMAGALSWQARLDALAEGAVPDTPSVVLWVPT